MIVRPALAAIGFALTACAQVPLAEPAATEENVVPDTTAVAIGPFEPTDADWRAVHPEDLVLIETVHGTIAIELNNDFSPNHAARMRELIRAGAYNGERFYRVIDGFVAQGGLQDEDKIAEWAPLENENDRLRSFTNFHYLGNADLFTREVGHTDEAFPMARDEEMGREWLLHCPGAVAMARDTDPNTGGTEFYIVLDAQRYLDRNLTIFGRVIDGMQHVQKLKRGVRAIESGVIQPPEQGDEMIRVRVAADIPEEVRPGFDVLRADRLAFEAAKQEKRVRDDPFFYRAPPEVLDICGFEVPVRQVD